MKPIISSLNKVINSLSTKQDKIFNQIYINWNRIVGDIAHYTFPKQIKNIQNKIPEKVLYIEVSNSSKALELSYKEHVIIERISIYFGYKLINRISFIVNSAFRETVVKDNEFKINNFFSLEDIDRVAQKFDNSYEEELKNKLIELNLLIKMRNIQ